MGTSASATGRGGEGEGLMFFFFQLRDSRVSPLGIDLSNPSSVHAFFLLFRFQEVQLSFFLIMIMTKLSVFFSLPSHIHN